MLQREKVKEWGLSIRTLQRYRLRVLQDHRDIVGDYEVELEKALAQDRFEELYQKAVKKGDIRTAMHIVRNRALVSGVIGPLAIRVDHEHRFSGQVPATPAEEMSDAQALVVLERAGRADSYVKRAIAAGKAGEQPPPPPPAPGQQAA
jgi:hypothetical protein